jgi:hypothetical protein
MFQGDESKVAWATLRTAQEPIGSHGASTEPGSQHSTHPPLARFRLAWTDESQVFVWRC